MKHVLKLTEINIYHDRQSFGCFIDPSITIPVVGEGILMEGSLFEDREARLFICQQFYPKTNFCRFLIADATFKIKYTDIDVFLKEGNNWFELVPFYNGEHSR